MREFKNIDRLFQENLKDFEAFPPNEVWDSIENRLIPRTKKRALPFWLKISSIAALFVLFFSVGTIYFLPKKEFSKNFFPKKNSNKEILNLKDTTPAITVEEKLKAMKKVVTALSQELAEIEHNNNFTAKAEEKTTEKTASTQKSENSFLFKDKKNLPFSKFANKEVSKKEITESKFSVATIFAPIYFNSFGDGSGVDAQFKDNSSSGNTSYSYGVKVAYQLTNKFSLQSGVNLINLGLTTNNIYVTPGVAIVGFSNLSANPFLARGAGVSALKENALNADNASEGSLNQVFGYVEIPVEVKYSVTDGKFGINLVGGFSTLLLNRDEVFVETNSFSQSLGSSNNLRSINFSGNIGLDVDYSIYKNLFINVSPMFKVQTSTFSKNSGSIQPYYLGVYTGLNYKF
ncbi:MAG: outer membrane beta-barrel protein [Lutibacter sp.]|nr:outer membrane beta-barrel protein [Lutibacter sp.]